MKKSHKKMSRILRPVRDDEGYAIEDLVRDSIATELAVEVIEKAQSGEDHGLDDLNAQSIEEFGGPFIETNGDDEYAGGTDRSNPGDATREPFPRT